MIHPVFGGNIFPTTEVGLRLDRETVLDSVAGRDHCICLVVLVLTEVYHFLFLKLCKIISIDWHACAETMGDFLALNTSTMQWTNLSSITIGTPPSKRDLFGFVASMDMLYLFGGHDQIALGDFSRFNPISLEWKNLDSIATGVPPSPRYRFGFASSGDTLYVFGGINGGKLSYSRLLNSESCACD